MGLAGGLGGSLLLLVTPGRVFGAVVPWLLLLATLVFAAGEKAADRVRGKAGRPVPFGPGLFAVSAYGGYFNGGLGIMLMALFAAAGMRDLNAMNGLKNGVFFVISAVSVAIFAAAGLVAWPAAALMMAGSTAGGYLGARLARLMPRRAVRALIVAVGLGMSALFFVWG